MKPIIILLLIFFGVRLLRKSLTKKIASKAPSQKEEVAGKHHGGEEMVLDPVCKSYVPISSAIRLSSGGRVEYFCRPECREKYEEGL